MDSYDDFYAKEPNFNCLYMHKFLDKNTHNQLHIMCGRTCVVCDEPKSVRTHAPSQPMPCIFKNGKKSFDDKFVLATMGFETTTTFIIDHFANFLGPGC